MQYDKDLLELFDGKPHYLHASNCPNHCDYACNGQTGFELAEKIALALEATDGMSQQWNALPAPDSEHERALNPTSQELWEAMRAKKVGSFITMATAEGLRFGASTHGEPLRHFETWPDVLVYLGLYTPPAAQPAEQS